MEKFIPTYLDNVVKLLGDKIPPDFSYLGLNGFVKENGQDFPISLDQTLPGPFKSWPNQCFDNAYRLARRWPSRYRYVEGVALSVIPMHHAWCIDKTNAVIDPTWSVHSKIGLEYFGVIIPLEIARQVRHKQNVSIIDNWQRRWPLLREPWQLVLQRNEVRRWS